MLSSGQDTYDWDAESHAVESDGRDEHDHEDNPSMESVSDVMVTRAMGRSLYHSVRLPNSPAASTSGREVGMTVGIGATEVALMRASILTGMECRCLDFYSCDDGEELLLDDSNDERMDE